MDFVDEQDVTRVQIGQQGSQVAGLFDGGAGSNPDIHSHLVGDDTGQGGFAQTGRTVEQGVVQRLISAPGRFNINGKVALGLLLAGVIGKQFRAQSDFPRVLGREGGGDDGAVQLLGKF